MWYEIKDDFVIFNLKIVPNSSKNFIAEILNGELKIKIKAPAVENAANKELVKFLSKTFKISKSQIDILSGETSKRKRVKLPINEKITEFITSVTKDLNEK